MTSERHESPRASATGGVGTGAVATGTAARTVAASLAECSVDDTALIGVDLDVLDARLDTLGAAFPESVRHAVAIKTMPHPAMLTHLVARGFGLEAASIEEVKLALAAGAASSDVIFDSPVKTRSEIAWCDAHLPRGLLNANSLAELQRYPSSPSFQVGLRVNPEVATGAPAEFDVSGDRSKFGVPISTPIDDLVDACISARVTALHMHIGSQVPTSDAHVAAVGRLLAVAADVDEQRSRRGDECRITTLDIGGGLHARAGHDDVMEQYGRRLQTQHPQLFDFDVRTEFGQWVHADAGWVASRIESVEERAVPMAFLHVGADLFLRDVYAGSGSVEYGFAVVRADGHVVGAGEASESTRSYDLVGPLCFAGDVLARDVELPELAEGDWLVMTGTGANTFGLWSRHCSRTIPRVVASRGAAHQIWSERTPPADVTSFVEPTAPGSRKM